MCSSRMTFAGQRPAGEGSNVAPLRESVEPVVPDLDQSPIGTFAASRSASLMPTLLASMLSAPVPCSNTFAATVSLNGFLAATIGSTAGFNAVPQPSHCLAASVAGVVIGSGLPTDCPPPCMAEDRPCEYPTTSRSAPARLSIAFPTSCDFGNPELPVTNTFPLRRTTKAPVGTVRHQTTPS